VALSARWGSKSAAACRVAIVRDRSELVKYSGAPERASETVSI
jgi:hypothetical protein